MKEMTELEVAQELGKQVHNNELLTCPICDQWRGPLDPKQSMDSYGDAREVLFLPTLYSNCRIESYRPVNAS